MGPAKAVDHIAVLRIEFRCQHDHLESFVDAFAAVDPEIAEIIEYAAFPRGQRQRGKIMRLGIGPVVGVVMTGPGVVMIAPVASLACSIAVRNDLLVQRDGFRALPLYPQQVGQQQTRLDITAFIDQTPCQGGRLLGPGQPAEQPNLIYVGGKPERPFGDGRIFCQCSLGQADAFKCTGQAHPRRRIGRVQSFDHAQIDH